jgi:ubiquinone/menaquinone biosynthesis C-methylase UbiE
LSKVSSRNDWESYWGSKNRAEEVYSNEDRIARNLEAVELPSGASVLEIGAGTGRDSLPLVNMGANVYQLDYSFESLRLIKQSSNHRNISPVGGDTFCLPFRDQTFDVVFHQGLLEHFRKDQADVMIKEQIRVLKVGGYLLIDVPQRYHPYTIIKHILIAMGKWFAGWERSFSFRELKSVMKAHGLYPVHQYGEWMVPSLWYRMLREVGKKVGVRMPLYPPGIPLLKDIRKHMRTKLLKTTLPLYTGISIGIIAQKKKQ